LINPKPYVYVQTRSRRKTNHFDPIPPSWQQSLNPMSMYKQDQEEKQILLIQFHLPAEIPKPYVYAQQDQEAIPKPGQT
jgi:hypothetical protein